MDLDRDRLDGLRRSLARFGSDQDILVHYSGLFLAPPVKARLNLCNYLDGRSNGASFYELELAYAHHGIAPADNFPDLPDHISMQLEFLSMLCGSQDTLPEAALFAHRFLLPAMVRLAQAIAHEAESDSPYLHLSKLAEDALRALAESVAFSGSPAKVGPLKYRHDSQKGVWRHCKSCEKPFAREKEIAVMTKALSENGLPWEHLELCPDCRDFTQGWNKRACMPGRC